MEFGILSSMSAEPETFSNIQKDHIDKKPLPVKVYRKRLSWIPQPSDAIAVTSEK
jgi:hypothetical protein